jgi:hypothetical protein
LYGGSLGDYLKSSEYITAIVIGLVSTPLAPVAKDLASSLQAAANAVNTVKQA